MPKGITNVHILHILHEASQTMAFCLWLFRCFRKQVVDVVIATASWNQSLPSYELQTGDFGDKVSIHLQGEKIILEPESFVQNVPLYMAHSFSFIIGTFISSSFIFPNFASRVFNFFSNARIVWIALSSAHVEPANATKARMMFMILELTDQRTANKYDILGEKSQVIGPNSMASHLLTLAWMIMKCHESWMYLCIVNTEYCTWQSHRRPHSGALQILWKGLNPSELWETQNVSSKPFQRLEPWNLPETNTLETLWNLPNENLQRRKPKPKTQIPRLEGKKTDKGKISETSA